MSALPVAGYLIEFGAKPRAGGTPAEDTAAPIDDAFRRGLAEGKAAARSECEAELERRSEEHAQQLAKERRDWAAETGEKLAGQLIAGLGSVEAKIAGSVAHVLEPFLIAELRRQTIDELVGITRELMSKDPGISMEISGPDDLLQVLRDRLAGEARNVRFSAGEGSDVRVCADQTILETRLGAWMARIEEALR